jgi:hypothetical protein
MWSKFPFFLNRNGDATFTTPAPAAVAADSPDGSLHEKKDHISDPEKGSQHAIEPEQTGVGTRDETAPDSLAHTGVQKAEAVTLVWTRRDLYLMYAS